MDDSEDLSFQLELLLNQSTDPFENDLSWIFNSNNTDTTATNSNNLTDDIFSLDQASLFSPTPVNIPINPRTSNNPPVMMPTPTISKTYDATHCTDAFPPLQNPTIAATLSAVDSPEPNWEAINAYLRGQVRPGADVGRVYRCLVCQVEFANPQALGGHMGSHTKNRKHREEGSSSKTGRSKKPWHH